MDVGNALTKYIQTKAPETGLFFKEIAMFKYIFQNWKWLGGLAVFFGLTVYIASQEHKINSLETKLVATQASAASYERALTELQADTSAKIRALELERTQGIKRAQEEQRILDVIEGASHEKNAPCAAVLCDTINSLYGHPTTTSKID